MYLPWHGFGHGINLFCHELGFWVVGINWMTVVPVYENPKLISQLAAIPRGEINVVFR